MFLDFLSKLRHVQFSLDPPGINSASIFVKSKATIRSNFSYSIYDLIIIHVAVEVAYNFPSLLFKIPSEIPNDLEMLITIPSAIKFVLPGTGLIVFIFRSIVP